MSTTTILLGVGVLAGIAVLVRFLTTPSVYPRVELSGIDRGELFERGEQLLRESESWPPELSEPGVSLRSRLGPFPVRTIRYDVEATDFERAVAHVKDLCDCGEKSRRKADKFEETLYDRNRGQSGHEWVRRSVHVAPSPGSNREVSVLYCEDRPTPKSYRVAFRSVDEIDGEPIPPYEKAGRFTVHPALFKVEETAPGQVRVVKIEAVDPQGLVSPLLNNYFVSIFFFRRYMFQEAKAMRDALAA